MRFEVPQFIEIEDKIFGPLTWRQFLYIGGGVGMGVVLFLTTSFIIFLVIGLPLALLAGALAFYPVNNRPFSFFLEALINFVKGKKLYLWQRKEQEVHKYSFAPHLGKLPQSGQNPVPSRLEQTTQRLPLARRLELEALQKSE